MKQLNFYLIIFFSGLTFLKGQCPEGFYATSQDQIDQFIIDYPNCENLNENLTIIGYPAIYNLDGLQNLKSVGGEVLLDFGNSGPNISMSGLSNLEFIGSHLSIINSNMFSISNAFTNLETIGGRIIINWNQHLSEIDDFNALTSCGDIEIRDNPKLVILNGFNSIQNIDGYIWITSTSGYDGETLEINGFQNLRSLSRSLSIEDSENYININAFENLEELGRGIYLNYHSDDIDSFNSLNHLDIYGAFIRVQGLLNLLPLVNLTTVINKITLIESDVPSLWGLENASQFTDLEIKYNTNLTFCSLPNICSYLQNGGAADISNNAPGCNSIQEVLDNCNMSINSQELNKKINVYPNPVKDFITITKSDNSIQIEKVILLDNSGKVLNEFKNEEKINLGFYPSGNYILLIQTDKETINKKIIIQ